MRTRLRQLRALWDVTWAASRRAWDLLPVTWAGLAVVGLSWWAFLRYGQEQGDLVLHSAAILFFALAGAAALFASLGALRLFLSLRRHDAPPLSREVDVGVPMNTGLSIPALRLWPFVEVRLAWVRPTDTVVELTPRGARLEETVRPGERGRIAWVDRRFTVADIFGLASVTFLWRRPAALKVVPAPASAAIALALRHTSGEGYSHPAGQPQGERVEMRRYQAGDPLRFVLWKIFARTRQLLVRTPERAITPLPSSVGCFVAGEGDEPAASTARVFLEEALLGEDFVFLATGSEVPACDAAQALEDVIDSVRHRARGGADLGRLLTSVDADQLDNTVLFVPGQPGPWMDRVLTFVRQLRRPPTIIVSGDGVLAEAPRGRLSRALFARPAAEDRLGALPELRDRLAASGATVHVLHVGTGRRLSEADLEALRS